MASRAALLIAAALAVLTAFASGSAVAQSVGGELSVTPVNSSVKCLDTSANTERPDYPNREQAARRGAVVRARLTFDSADGAPQVEVFYNSGSDKFATIVREYLERYRLPCYVKGSGPQVMTQEFAFDPSDGRKVFSSDVWPESRPLVSCMEFGNPKPKFRREGTVLLRMTFTSPLDAPTVQVLYNSGPDWFAGDFVEYVSGYRAKCMEVNAGPIHAEQVFRAEFEGSATYVLQDMKLQQFLGYVVDYKRPHVWFDTTTMGCPFDLRFEPLQPYAENNVAQIDRNDPNRRGFVEWLRTLALKVPAGAVPHVIGTPFLISVPCATVDLS